MDGGGVDRLAGRLGVGSRHLRRLFLRHVGATPVAVAGTRRLHFARRLLDETDLPMGDVAEAAGFSSERRFRAAVRARFGLSPSRLRASSRRDGSPAPDGRLTLRLSYRPPLDGEALLGYLRARATPGVEDVTGDVYRRTFVLPDAAGVLAARLDPAGRAVVLDVPVSARRHLLAIAERIRRLFDVAADPAAVADRLGRDPALRASVRARPGLRVPGAWDPFELCVRAILGQQVSVRAAKTLAGRLAAAFGPRVPGAPADGPHRGFPGPDVLADADVAAIGIPRARGDAIRGLARRLASGALPLAGGECPDDTERALAAIPGIGSWTASYVAMRALGRPDAFLEGDLGVRRALANGAGRLPRPSEALARAEAWRPWRAYAVMHLWAGPPGPSRNGEARR